MLSKRTEQGPYARTVSDTRNKMRSCGSVNSW